MNFNLKDNKLPLIFDINFCDIYSLLSLKLNKKIINYIRIKNNSDFEFNYLKIKIYSSRKDLFNEKEIVIDSLKEEETLNISNIELNINEEVLKNIEKENEIKVFVEVLNNENQVICLLNKSILLLPFLFFSTKYYEIEAITSLINFNEKDKNKFIDLVLNELNSKFNKNQILAYKNKDINELNREILCIYNSFLKFDFSLINLPSLYLENGIFIKNSEELINKKRGNELDFALFFASIFEYFSFSPILFFIKNKVYLSIWTKKSSFYNSSFIDDEIISSLLLSSSIISFDITKLIKGENYLTNINETKETLINNKNNLLVLDISTSRKNGYLPINFDNENKSNYKSDLLKEELKENTNKLKYWEKRLLDISKNNKLINLKPGLSTFQILTSSLYDLNYLLNQDHIFKLIPSIYSSVKSKKIFDSSLIINKNEIKDKLLKNEIFTSLNEKEYQNSLYQLFKKSRSDEEETGISTLYIALGIFSYKESLEDKNEFYAPILLYPIKLNKRDKFYEFEVINTEPIINKSLYVLLHDEFKVDIDTDDEIPYLNENEDLIDLERIISKLKLVSNSSSRFNLYMESFIGRFSFSNFLIWNDIKNNENLLKENLIIRSFINEKKLWNNDHEFNEFYIDNSDIYKNYLLPLEYDSSQLEAILKSQYKDNFILIGPPGTGKSQTITNIIVNAICNDKKVLFCSEKKAALDVVFERLKKIKLDIFALEMYSSKKDKKIILKELERLLNFGEVAKSKDYTNLIYSLEEDKEKLEELNKLMNTKTDFGYSLIELIVNYLSYGENIKELELNNFNINKINDAKIKEINVLLNKINLLSSYFPPFKDNPFSHYHSNYFSLKIKDEIEKLLKETSIYLDNFLNKFEILKTKFKLNDELNDKIFDLATLLKFINEHDIYLPLISVNFDKNYILKIKEMVLEEENFYKKADYLLSLFDKNIDSFNITDLLFNYKKSLNSKGINKKIITSKLLSKLKKKSIDPKKINETNLNDILISLSSFYENKRIIKKNSIILKTYIKNDYKEYESNYDLIYKNIDNTLSFYDLILKLSNYKIKDGINYINNIYSSLNLENNKKIVSDFIDNSTKLINSLLTLHDEYKFDYYEDLTNLNLNSLKDDLLFLIKNINLINEYSNLLTCFISLNNYSLDELILLYKNGESFEEIIYSFNKTIYKLMVSETIKKNHFENFLGENYLEIKNNFIELNNIYKKEAINEAASILSKNIPFSYSSSYSRSELGILKSAIKSNGRGMSLRKIFSLISSTILKMKPVFFVSPLSCVKYLDPSIYHFDIVIFDEASQFPTQEALPLIYRGDSLIISGDDKQLPPTNFFEKQINSEIEGNYNDLESILDDALAISFPISKLNYHYRSKDESLISFSNNKFYNNELITFPSFNKDKSIFFNRVNGIYDLGNTSTNKIEANKLIDDLINDIKNNEDNSTYGIIAFSIHQMNLIDTLLNEKVEKDKELKEKLERMNDPLFIKNLENVQGDERDIIYLSICYGKDKNNRFVQNFGPLNIEGGYRRLNVAITRSKKRMHVYSSIDYKDININKTNSEGVKYLRDFLEYIEYGNEVLINKNINIYNKEGIEKLVKQDLIKLGYKVETNIGKSVFKIDLVIYDPKNEDKYLLGILFDSFNFNNIKTTKDKNIIVYNKLRSMGWKLMFIYSLDYYLNKEKVLLNITNKIKELNKTGTEYKKVIDNNVIEFNKVETKKEDYSKPYLMYTLKNKYNEDQFLNKKNKETIYKIIKNIIEVEAPISINTIKERVRDLFSIKRKNKENELVLNYFISKIDNPYSYSYNNIKFFFKNNSDFTLDFYRKNNGRDILDISKEEVGFLIMVILKEEISIDKKSLIKETAIRLNFKNKTNKIENAINDVINYLESEDFIKINQNNFIELK